ncbi:hypothetical protein J8F10_08850 [Gemmata sp. G18]|uniref:Uncharacterized protein n=1 Tax=Gemmata palustris TaxID=2822762 RepID=A0ABS5BNT0_9BACT|nr:hypothetical protein [Gemmata palustris]MBP3955387.1 hypothetical protein [Gemmata palustris]
MAYGEGNPPDKCPLKSAVEQAVGPDEFVRISRWDIARLIQARGPDGESLFRLRYDRVLGLQPEFMGKTAILM